MNIASNWYKTFTGDPAHTAILGMGNANRSDDGIGLLIAEGLQHKNIGAVFSEIERPVDHWVMTLLDDVNIHDVLFIDASDFEACPGTVRLLQGAEITDVQLSLSTHQPPMTLLLQLLAQSGKAAWLLAIQPQSLELFGPVSPWVQPCVRDIVHGFLQIFEEGPQ